MSAFDPSSDPTETPNPAGAEATSAAPQHQSPVDQAKDAVKKVLGMITGRSRG